MSVGVLMSVRFVVAGVLMAVIVRARGIAIRRRGVIDGVWLGIILAVLFWLQTDGMRFTTTAKSGFITGLYVLFTPLIAVTIGQRVKLTSLLGAAIATYGLYLLVHLPGGWWSGWNRGDIETLGCAFLCGVHIVLMGKFTRRSDAWLLASSQVITCGIISLGIVALQPLEAGSQNRTAGTDAAGPRCWVRCIWRCSRRCSPSGRRPRPRPGWDQPRRPSSFRSSPWWLPFSASSG